MISKSGKTHEWPSDSAGSIMTDQVPIFQTDQTVASIDELLKQNIHHYKTLNYIYIVDSHHKFKGMLTVKQLYEAKPDVMVSTVMKKDDLITVNADAAQEHATALALKHNIRAVPVVNERNKLLGVIPSHTLFRVVYKEAREDILHLAGIKNHSTHPAYDNILEIPIFQAIRHRLPWLIIGLFGGVFTSHIVRSFELTLEKNILLAAFIPLIVYMSDAVGTQMEAFAIRDFAVSKRFFIIPYLLKQISIVIIVGAISAYVLFMTGLLLYGDISMSLIVSIALFFSILSSVFTGLLIPYAFSKLKIDPANASGPIATIIQDMLSIIIYFFVASMILK